jgi:phosphatidylglycerophosphatase A
MKYTLSRLFASLLYVGFIPGMPGTYGSIITAFVFWILCSGTGPAGIPFHIGAVLLLTLIGIVASAEIARRTGVDDPSFIVIDEAAGQLLTFIFIPVTGMNIIFGVVLFRTFDIWKPFPIRKLENLGGGTGIMADDLLAGVYGNLLLQIINLLFFSL